MKKIIKLQLSLVMATLMSVSIFSHAGEAVAEESAVSYNVGYMSEYWYRGVYQSESAVSFGLFSKITQTSVLVPPISKAIKLDKFSILPKTDVATTPPEGPDIRDDTGFNFAVLADKRPPADWLIKKDFLYPLCLKPIMNLSI